MKELKKRWGIQSNFQLAIIFIVFAITGSTSAWISKPVCMWLGIFEEDFGNWFILIRLLIIFPLYQVLLVLIGALFGQFRFFWSFEKKMLTNTGFGFFFKR